MPATTSAMPDRPPMRTVWPAWTPSDRAVVSASQTPPPAARSSTRRWAPEPSRAASRTSAVRAPATASRVGPSMLRTGGPSSGAWSRTTDSTSASTADTSDRSAPNITSARVGTPPMRLNSCAMAASPVEARNNRPEVVVRARMRAAATTATATPGKKTRRSGVLSRISSFSSQTKLHSISSTSGSQCSSQLAQSMRPLTAQCLDHGSPCGSPPAVTRQNSGGLAGFDP